MYVYDKCQGPDSFHEKHSSIDQSMLYAFETYVCAVRPSDYISFVQLNYISACHETRKHSIYMAIANNYIRRREKSVMLVNVYFDELVRIWPLYR